MTANPGTITIALLGKTGHGKSATGNTILKMIYFKESSPMSFSSKLVKDGENKIDGNVVTVYDIPGPYDTDVSEASAKQKAVEYCNIMMGACPKSGVNAFVLVLNHIATFGVEEISTVNIYEQIFGADFLKTHGILVFTHGEEFDQDKNFKKLCEEQTGPMKKMIDKFKDNVVLVSNKGAFDGVRGQNGDEILKLCFKKRDNVFAYKTADYDKYAGNRMMLLDALTCSII